MKSNGKHKTYRFYRWSARDPVVQRTNILLDGQKLSAVAKRSGVTSGTLARWRKLKVTRPNFTTIAAVWASQGRKSVPIA